MYIKNLIKIIIENFFKVNRSNTTKAKDIMVKIEEFNIQNLKLGNTYKVYEEVFVKDFISKIIDDQLTIVVVDKRGETKGYINKKQIDIIPDIEENYDRVRIKQ